MPLAKLATKIMLGVSLDAQNVSENRESKYYAVKEAVFHFPNLLEWILLGPEMKSTGKSWELENIQRSFYKIAVGSGIRFPAKIPGKLAFISVRDHDKPAAVDLAENFRYWGLSWLRRNF